MATFTLADLKAEVSKKYAPTIVENGDEEFVLQNLLQLPAKRRTQVLNLTSDVGGEDKEFDLDEEVKVFRKIIEIVTEDDKGKELNALLGDNDALVVQLVTTWMDGTQLGEAEPSSD